MDKVRLDTYSILEYSFDCIVLCSAHTFNAKATVQGDTITVNINYETNTVTTATFQCQLDSGPFEDCMFCDITEVMFCQYHR